MGLGVAIPGHVQIPSSSILVARFSGRAGRLLSGAGLRPDNLLSQVRQKVAMAIDAPLSEHCH